MSRFSVTGKSVGLYELFLRESSRPPSKGGNTKALHAHFLTIDGVVYSFLALGSQKWVYKSDSVSFEYEINGGYNNIIKDTLVAFDKSGTFIVRGNREFKPKLRTAIARSPASRREQRD